MNTDRHLVSASSLLSIIGTKFSRLSDILYGPKHLFPFMFHMLKVFVTDYHLDLDYNIKVQELIPFQ